MKLLVCLLVSCDVILGAIRDNSFFNKLLNVKPVGRDIQVFVPLTDIPPPPGGPQQSGRRHLETKCVATTEYDDTQTMSEATVIMPDHIDHKHFDVTSPAPYLTVGPIDAVGYFHGTLPPMDECEKIYVDHLAEQYSDEAEYSPESLEIARMPARGARPFSLERLEDEYASM